MCERQQSDYNCEHRASREIEDAFVGPRRYHYSTVLILFLIEILFDIATRTQYPGCGSERDPCCPKALWIAQKQTEWER